jgi:hypothetical protein
LEDAKAYFMKYYNNSVENYIDYNGKGEILYRCTLDDGTDVTLRLTSKEGSPTIDFTDSDKYNILAQHIHFERKHKNGSN